jgi:positive regulator of sigma E activity
MSKDGIIEHEGIVKVSDGNSVTVLLTPIIACKGCHSEHSCGMSGNTEKEVTIQGNFNVRTGDQVVVTMKQSLGYSALAIGYLLPLLLVFVSLVVLLTFSVNELIAGLISVGVLIPYYSGLFLYRKYIDRGFSFNLKTS